MFERRENLPLGAKPLLSGGIRRPNRSILIATVFLNWSSSADGLVDGAHAALPDAAKEAIVAPPTTSPAHPSAADATEPAPAAGPFACRLSGAASGPRGPSLLMTRELSAD